MSIPDQVSGHYGFGGLRARIEAGIEAAGKPVTTSLLGALDEFHIGGRPATVRLLSKLGIAPGSRVLDLGSGLGGPARHIAESTGATVTGIDLTAEFVEAARWLTEQVGLSDLVRFEIGSATELPFGTDVFDVATMLHVGMNIEDKPALCRAAADALQPGGRFGIYDVMAGPEYGVADFGFPVPWASDETTSFVEPSDRYVECLESAGFVVDAVIDHTDAALAFFDAASGPPPGGPPPLGLHLVMGADTPHKMGNTAANLRAGRIAPTEIIATLPT